MPLFHLPDKQPVILAAYQVNETNCNAVIHDMQPKHTHSASPYTQFLAFTNNITSA